MCKPKYLAVSLDPQKLIILKLASVRFPTKLASNSIMQAIEFKTILQNGTVTLPPEYASQWEGKTIRVLVLDDSEPVEESVQPNQTLPFQAISLKTKGFKFNREEANAR